MYKQDQNIIYQKNHNGWQPLMEVKSELVTAGRPKKNINIPPKEHAEPINWCLPGLLLIGAQKGGTTSFHVYLKDNFHPKISVPGGLKELDYFNKYIERGRGFNQYLKSWGQCQGDKLLIEASPNYLVHPRAAERAHRSLPQTKVLVMLRNPISRLISAFNMKWQEQVCGDLAWQSSNCYQKLIDSNKTTLPYLKDSWKKTFTAVMEEELNRLEPCYEANSDWYQLQDCLGFMQLGTVQRWHRLEDESHIYRSIYVDQLIPWLQHYGSDNVRIWSSEEFQKEPLKYMTSMIDWFGLKKDQINTNALGDGYKHHARSYIVPMAEVPMMDRLLKFFDGHNKRLFKLLDEYGYIVAQQELKKHIT